MARTIRPKIHARPDFLGSIPELSANAAGTKLPEATDWTRAQESLDLDSSVPGERGGRGEEEIIERVGGEWHGYSAGCCQSSVTLIKPPSQF